MRDGKGVCCKTNGQIIKDKNGQRPGYLKGLRERKRHYPSHVTHVAETTGQTGLQTEGEPGNKEVEFKEKGRRQQLDTFTAKCET